MYSTITRFVSLGLVVSAIIFSSYIFFSDTLMNASSAQNSETTPAQHASEKALETDEVAAAPIVKLASLSIITDYPAANGSDLSANLGMSTEERIIKAKQLASTQNFEEALRMLETKPSSDQEKYVLNYLRAQILSWAGNHHKAEQAFIELRRQYPQDADIAVSLGYLHLYQNNYEDAARLFSQVLARFPDYQDAQHGLKRATAIQ